MANRSITPVNVDLEDTVARTFVLFVQTADAVLKYADTRFYKAGLSIAKFVVLQVLAANGGTMTPSEIAEWTLREPHNITTLVDRMRKEGLIKTEPHRSDKRSINVTLTDKGRKVLSQSAPVAREIVAQVMSSITDGHTAALGEPLRLMRQSAHRGLEHINEHSEPKPG